MSSRTNQKSPFINLADKVKLTREYISIIDVLRIFKKLVF